MNNNNNNKNCVKYEESYLGNGRRQGRLPLEATCSPGKHKKTHLQLEDQLYAILFD